MKLIFERSVPGRGQDIFPECDVEVKLPESPLREKAPNLPEISENELGRHYTKLARASRGVNDGFYPLGSCTMKHNPRINEVMASLPGFTRIHPLQPADTVKGCTEVVDTLRKTLCEITGMDDMTFQPAAGAQGEFTGLLLIKAYHKSRGDEGRKEIIIPDSAHGTNPASAAMAGYDVVVIKSNEKGMIDLDDLKAHLGPQTAGLMLTNPNTVGLFDENILEITRLVHEAGGLCYYDGANLNAVIGIVRPGDIGFDVIHLNLHKTFSTPHGGGGPGSGPVGVAAHLVKYLPTPHVVKENGKFHIVNAAENPESAGQVSAFMGNFGVILRAYAYILMLGKQNLLLAGRFATMSANYIKECLKDCYKLPIPSICKHEFVFDGLIDDGASKTEDGHGATTLDVAKRLLDFGFHAPTIYFPLLFHQAIMIEPTETESKETIDAFIDVMRKIAAEAAEDPAILKGAPHNTPISRPDETRAARQPILKYGDA